MSAATDGRSTRASQKRRSRRRAILQAARRVFGERGYHRTHVADLIEAAGIARGTFYLYFESKGAVFAELLDEVLDELRKSIVGVDATEDSASVETQLIGTVQRLLRKVIENRYLTAIIVREAVGLDEDVDRRLSAFYSELLDYIQQALDEGKRIRIVREVDTSVAAFCILGTIKQLMEQLISESQDSVDVDTVAFAVLDFNLRGVLK